jgi:type II secretory pathway component PulC
MNPPAPLPPKPTVESNPVPTPPPKPTLQFAGKLLGVIVDEPPKPSFAILELQSKQIVLVPSGELITSELPGLTVERVDLGGIVLQNGDQFLEIPIHSTPN